MTVREHIRNTTRDEYEAQAGSSHELMMIFVGNTERAAVRRAAHLLTNDESWVGRGETHCRLYHTHPSPGPVRRYVGTVTPQGELHRAR